MEKDVIDGEQIYAPFHLVQDIEQTLTQAASNMPEVCTISEDAAMALLHHGLDRLRAIRNYLSMNTDLQPDIQACEMEEFRWGALKHDESEYLPVFCAWHPGYFGHEFQIAEPAPETDDQLVSYGICPRCSEIFKEEQSGVDITGDEL